jgi:hypothetical protein
VGLSLFAVYLVVQVLVAAEFGLVNGNKTSQELTVQGQLVVNFDQVPEASRICDVLPKVAERPGTDSEHVHPDR